MKKYLIIAILTFFAAENAFLYYEKADPARWYRFQASVLSILP